MGSKNKKKIYLFEVSVETDNSREKFRVSGRDDVEARAKAIKKFESSEVEFAAKNNSDLEPEEEPYEPMTRQDVNYCEINCLGGIDA